MVILGISAFYHDSAAAIVQDGEIIAAAQEERFTRKKHDASFPLNAVNYCLEQAGFSLSELDAVVFYDKPFLKFERLLETYFTYAPKGLKSFITAIPVWVKEKLFLKKLLYDELKKIGEFDKEKMQLLFTEHHLSHAASAFYPSSFNKAAILTLDGVGEWATASISLGEGKDITVIKELRFPHSVGLLYSAFTYYLGFRVNSGEYKLMGLAPYGNMEDEQTKKFILAIKKGIVDIKDDGSIWMNQQYFNYASGLTMVNERKWNALFGTERRKAETEIAQVHCNMSLAIQVVTEEIVIKMAKEAKKLTGADYLCLAGGVALNCVANGKLANEGIFKDIFIQPAAGDAGCALGAALATHHIYFEQPRIINYTGDALKGSYLGPQYGKQDIVKLARKYKAVYTEHVQENELSGKVAGLLAEGKIIGWMQGRMEFGPRALGGRSILADARNSETQKKLNLSIKYRESFRPFAPSVLKEEVANYFNQHGESPYMLLVQTVKEGIRNPLPQGYSGFPLKEKLYFVRSSLPAITHIDFSARIQTVSRDTNPRYWELISAFKKLTGCAVIVNTSFNVRSEPIVCTPEDAYRCFMRTEMDYLVIENCLFSKTEQPEWQEKDNWKEEFTLD